jgi:thioredoxin reductase (NADPH)
MSSFLPPSALNEKTEIFPTLTPELIDRIRPSAHVRQVHEGEILFDLDDTGIPFFVLLSGAMDIVQPTLKGEKLITHHDPGEFTGEISMISGQRCLVRGRVTKPGEFLEVSSDNLKALVAKDAELSEIFLRAFILRRLALIRHGLGNLVLLGSRHSARTLEIREFLTRVGHPYSYVDLDTDRDSQELLDRFHVAAAEVPVVICNGKNVMRGPTVPELANCLGYNVSIDRKALRDVIIVGAGPAGLAAAVYGASEGLDVLVIETQAPGGQAGSSSKIENYLGFPVGISGQELAARATTQAQKFGADMMVARKVARLDCDSWPYHVLLESGERLPAKTIVIATGAQYKKPHLENLQKFEGKGIYYGATYIEAQLCGSGEVAVVGGANSAGQAAAFLSQTVGKVHMLVRSSELKDTMSRYLIQRLTENPKIQIHFNTEIVSLEGAEQLERVVWKEKTSDQLSTHDIQHVFIMTGASPHTDWLRGCLALDAKGFILTGRELDRPGNGNHRWTLDRPPQMLETSLPGVFAVGDVRAGNVKRVASAVGEGAISISMVHRALAEL